MADRTGIEWTDATWNPIVGCSVVSPGCTNCYAMKMAARIEAMQPGSHYAGTTQASKAGAVWTGKLALAPESILTQPLRWRRPRKIFVNSMGDLFHESVPDEWIDRVFAITNSADWHTYQVLTKRSARMRAYMTAPGLTERIADAQHEMGLEMRVDLPARNIWLGVSTEDQRRADERVPDLLATPAAIRFVSAEPLLGPLDVRRWIPTCYECGASCGLRLPGHPDVERCTACEEECGPDTEPAFSEGCPKCSGELEPVCPDCGHYMVYQHPDTPNLDLVIVGGESGPNARPMHPDWTRSLRDQCAAAGTAFFFKQHGEWLHEDQVRDGQHPGARFFLADGSPVDEAPPFGPAAGRLWHWWAPDHKASIRIGKRAAGRLLDGVQHNAMPEVRT